MVANALPGEQVVATIDQAGSKLWQGRSTSIITASPVRLAAPCKLYGVCGGCQLQHLQHANQLPVKQQTVSDHLRRNGFKEQAWSEPLLSIVYYKPKLKKKNSELLVQYAQCTRTTLDLSRHGNICDCMELICDCCDWMGFSKLFCDRMDAETRK